jgi:Fe-S cluster assembly protein SufD
MPEVAMTKTAAEQQLAAQWRDAKPRLPGDGAVRALRDDAFKRFEAEGLPHRRIEEWKYTDLRALLRETMPLAGAPDAAAKARAADAGKLAGDIDARRIVFVDGAFVPELSDVSGLPDGLTVRSMAEALSAGDPRIAAHFGKVAPGEGRGDSVVALNTALMRDGALVHVAEGATIERPIHLVFASVGAQPVSVFNRSLIVIEKNARAMLVESHESSAGHQVNAAIQLVVGEGAHFDHVKIVSGADDAVHVGSLMASVAARARFSDFSFNAGCGVVRNQLFMRFDGEDSLANIRGASLLKGTQHGDTTLVADHLAPGCQSRELFKAVLDGRSRSVFQGRIAVRQAAQRTDAKMMTRALLLSEEAEAASKPELEIFADNVQCGHGATTGSLDESLKFYLMARGIPEPEAEALLVQAFVGEAVEGIEDAGLRDALMEQVAAWLRARGD